MKSLQRVILHYREERARLLMATAFLVFGVLLGLARPWPFAVLVDSVLGTDPFSGVWGILENTGSRRVQVVWLCLLAGFIQLWMIGLGYAQNRILLDIGLRGLKRIRLELFECLLKRPFTEEDKGIGKGSFLYRATWDAYAYQSILNQGIFPFIQAGLSLVCMFAVMLSMHMGLTLVLMVFIPFMAVWMRCHTLAMTRRTRSANEKDSKVLALYEGILASLPLIQVFSGENRERDRFSSSSEKSRLERLRQHHSEIGYQTILSAAFACMSILITVWGAFLVLEQSLPLGNLLVFIAYLGQLHEPLQQLSRVSSTYSESLAGIERIEELIQARPKMKADSVCGGYETDAHAREMKWLAAPEIEFKEVTFSYLRGREILKKANLHIAPGTWLGVTGASGQGKTTLLLLLVKLLSPQAGRILISNQDLQGWDTVNWRDQISFSPQPAMLVPGTLLENITYGQSDMSPDWKEATGKMGLDASLGSRDFGEEETIDTARSGLSAGELQRINLVRACLKKASIYIFDEPASGLDEEHEKMFYAHLLELAADKTVIMVTHHPERIPRLDRLIRIENGAVIELNCQEKSS